MYVCTYVSVQYACLLMWDYVTYTVPLLLSCPCVKVATSSAVPKKLGAFTLHDDQPAVSSGSLLFKRDSSKAEGASPPPSSSASVSVAAHARMASVAALRKKEEREKEQSPAVGSSGGGTGTGSSGIKLKEGTLSSTSSTTAPSSASASKPAGTGLKRQVSKTATSAAVKGKQKKTSETLRPYTEHACVVGRWC